MGIQLEIRPTIILDDRITTGLVAEKTYASNPIGIVQSFKERVGDIVAGRMPMPVHYKVEARMISSIAVKERVGSLPEILETSRDYLYSHNSGLELKVLAAYNHLFGGGRTMTHLNLVILRNPHTDEMELAGKYLASYIKIGAASFCINYLDSEPFGTATLGSVRPLTFGYYGNPHLINHGTRLTPRQITELRLEERGFPPKVDWLNTAAMYVLGITPNNNGVLMEDNRPLTARDIHHQALIPARQIPSKRLFNPFSPEYFKLA